jgi:hypothetical protein
VRSRAGRDGSEGATAVDATLEQILDDVAQAVGAYLVQTGESERDALVAALRSLDEQTDHSDAYENSLENAPIWGVTGKGSVLGETGAHPFVEMVPNTVLQAQIAIVKCAKAEAQERSLTTLEALRAASVALDDARRHSE